MTLNIKATDFCDVSNSAGGVIKARNELQSGDTLICPKNEYHFYKDRCIHKVCHMTNTDSFKADVYKRQECGCISPPFVILF